MSVGDITITGATPSDLPAIKALLVAHDLPTAGVDNHWKTFVVARDGDDIVACGGSEAYKVAALIRSIAVTDAYRGRGIGRLLVRHLLDRLASRGIREFYLLTTTAQPYFSKRGFKVIDRDEIHPQLLASTELQGACPDSAVCMRLLMLA
jgi:amino-acid N-acetyltransferase